MKLTKAVRYRVEQFLRALTAEHALSERKIERAAEILPPRARALFVRQAPQDQLHALDVYETLLEDGHTNKDLLTAALLHDVGKAATEAPPWQRGMFVLAERFAPGILACRSRNRSGERERPLTTYANHAEIGARWAERAGCSTLAVDLIRHHECHPDTTRTERDRLLALLRAADNVN